MIKYYNLNGVQTPIEKAYIHISDLAIHRGYGIFDYFVVTEGEPVFFDDYLDRFEESAAKMHLRIPLSRVELKTQIRALIAANEAPNSAIKLVLTGGYSSDGYTPEQENLFILAYPQITYSEELMTKGLHLLPYEHVRDIPEIKTLNYVASLMAQQNMLAVGAQDVLYHKNGYVSESSRSNFYLVKEDNTIVTSDRDVLFGITRKHLLLLAKEHYKVEVRAVFLDEVFSAKEAFISSSTKGAFPVTRVADKWIGNGKAGKVTMHLDKMFNEHVEAYIQDRKALA